MLRILPFLIIFLFVLVFSRVMNIFENIPEIFSISVLNAQSTASKDPAPPPPPSSSPPPTGTTPPPANQDVPTPTDQPAPMKQFTPVEVEILESLTKRREELDSREKEIGLKEAVLNVTEKRINLKIGALQNLMTEAKKILGQYNEKHNQEILTLVKIYENMKPKDAARIFDDLEMPILVEVSSRMKEAKVAAILGLMSSERAKDLTIELANRRKIDLSNYN